MSGAENKVALSSKQSARRPSSRSATCEPEPCEGWQASPSNPNQPAINAGTSAKQAAVFFYCSAEEKAMIRQVARDRGLSMSAFLRHLAAGTEAKRRRKLPRVDPALVRAVGRVGGNLNQVARWLNRAAKSGHVADVEALKVVAQLVAIERQLGRIVEVACDAPEDTQC